MSLPNSPPRATPYTIRQGDTGWGVYAVQRSVGAFPDGIWSFNEKSETQAKVKAFQSSRRLVVDGIVGQKTQIIIGNEAIYKAERATSVPEGLMKGLVANESGSMIAPVNWSVPGGVDCGITQYRVPGPPFSLASLKHAFDPDAAAASAAANLATQIAVFKNQHPACPYTPAELAALSHNWPSAAERFHKYGSLGTSGYKIAEWAPKSLGTMTWNQWAAFYIKQATKYMVR